MVRQYHHLKMLKRAGRGNDASGAAGTLPRQCAVVCPACPRPGINLDANWINAPQEKRSVVKYHLKFGSDLTQRAIRFLYTLFLGMDANFRLKRKMVSTDAADPGLSNGWAYFVDESEFKDFLDAFGNLIVQEVSTVTSSWKYTSSKYLCSPAPAQIIMQLTRSEARQDLLHQAWELWTVQDMI